MINNLLSGLAALGYEISLVGENVKLLYKKLGTPPSKAQPLIDELRKCKPEAIKILAAKKQMAIWPSDMQELINWLMEAEVPTEPFYLEPHRWVIDPEKFFAAIKQEIKIGPRGPRYKTGALLYDLKVLRKNLH